MMAIKYQKLTIKSDACVSLRGHQDAWQSLNHIAVIVTLEAIRVDSRAYII
jgi:gamma-glutamyl phosphate reductase